MFYRPLLDNGFSDLVNLLFPNLPDMLEIHGRFNTLMKARKRDQPAVETVGDILVAMVSIFLFFDFRSEGGGGNPVGRLPFNENNNRKSNDLFFYLETV